MGGPFEFRGGELCCDEVPLREIAERYGTPTFVYSAAGLLERYRAYDEAFGGVPHLVCYAVKANGNLGVLRVLAEAGAGFDIVSAGELYRVIEAGGDPAKTVFSGVGKTAAEMRYALERGIHSFNCESESELETLSAVATSLGAAARIAVRVNPDIDAQTHPKISTGLRDNKFGVDIAEVESVYERAARMPGLSVEGVSCHIGSLIMEPAPLMQAADSLIALTARLQKRGLPIRTIDFGGGLGIAYRAGETAPTIADFVAQVRSRAIDLGLTAMVEPGRSVVGECGALIAEVVGRKRNRDKEFVILDAAMNDLLRPTLYEAHHEIVPLAESGRPPIVADIVGPVCETGDYLARARSIAAVEPGERVALLTCGAYGFSMSSNYNARPRAAEVLVENGASALVRRRETFEDLIRGESRG
ncbi:MAG: diaminopimelate decarboxylase [Bryobacteraceae bacterium]|nr:diaminopimelate decarboxylase [Bryobacteraceae bacterium]